MTNLSIDFSKNLGKIKPMNAVNNGPAGSRERGHSNFDNYKALNIPYARLHDSAFYTGYGGEFAVDVHRVFPNFDADENDPKSYIFEPTDNYLKAIDDAGTKIFYRLGASIEHGYKKGTYPPKDFLKWARICEHIILHYTCGWANGYHYNIEYWEIWNEPDCENADGSNPCWQGTKEQFIDFYITTSKYLKSKFPHLKIGGPALCAPWGSEVFLNNLLTAIKKANAPLDFYSYHWYGKHLTDLIQTLDKERTTLDELGFNNTITILNEWNYIRGWLNENWEYSRKMEKGLKGASFVAGAMCVGQAGPLDMLMYYEARPCDMSGLFDTDFLTPLKTYYVFKAFNELVNLETCVYTNTCDDVYVCGAKNDTCGVILLTYYREDDEIAPNKQVKIQLNNIEKKKIELYLINEEKNLELVKTLDFSPTIDLNLLCKDVYLIKLID